MRIYEEDGEEWEDEDDLEEATAEIVLVARGHHDAKIRAERYNKGEVLGVERYYNLKDKRFFERAMGRSLDVIEEVLDD